MIASSLACHETLLKIHKENEDIQVMQGMFLARRLQDSLFMMMVTFPAARF